MSELLTELMNYGFKRGLGWSLESMPADWPSVYYPPRHMAVINTNWKGGKQVELSAAHELGHFLNNDQGDLYKATFAIRSKVEKSATQRGLDLLVPMYFQDTDQEAANTIDFMEQLHVPARFESYVSEQVAEYYNGD